MLLLSVFLLSFGSAWGAFIPYTGALPTPQTSTLSVENNQVVIKTSELLSLAGVDYSGKQHYIRIQLVDGTGSNVEFSQFKQQYVAPWYTDNVNHFETCIPYGYVEYQKGNNGDFGYIVLTLTLPNNFTTDFKINAYVSDKNSTDWGGTWPDYHKYEPEIKALVQYSLASTTYLPGTEPSSENKITQFVASGATSAEMDLWTSYGNDIKAAFPYPGLNQAYIKWYLRDKSTKAIVDVADSPFSSTVTDPAYSFMSSLGYVWHGTGKLAQSYDWGGGNQGVNWDNNKCASTFKVTYTPPTGASISDYEVVCVISDSEEYTANPTDPYELTEPTFKLKYVYQFMTAADLDDAFTAGDDSGAETVNKVIEHTATTASVNLNNYFDEIKHKLGDITDLSDFYLRWYLVKNGTEVEDKTVYSTGGQLLSFDGNYDSQSPDLFINKKEGKIFYEKLHSGEYIGDFTNANQQGAKNVTFTLPSGDNWSDYKIVCVMTDAATEGGVDAANGNSSFHGVNTSHDVLITEPTIKLKYVFEMKTEDEIKAMFTVSDDASTKLGGAYQGVKLLDDATATSIDVNLTESGVFADWSKANAFGDDTETDQFVYTRFLLVDKNGAPIDMTNYTLECNTTLPTGVRSQTLANNQLVIYAPTSGFTQDLMNIKVTTTGTPDWTNVRLAAVIANDATGLNTANDMNYTSSGDDKLGKSTQYLVVNEPAEFYSAWMCKFVTDAEDLFVEGNADNARTRTVYQLKTDATTFTVDLNKFADKIAKDFDKADISGLMNFYLRWYIADRSTGTYLADAGNMISMKTLLTGNDVQVAQKYGLIWAKSMSGAGSLGANVLNAKVWLPAGYTQDDVDLVCLMTDDLSGMGGAKGDLQVSADPTTLKWKYTVRFIDEEEAKEIAKENYAYVSTTPTTVVKTHTTVVETDTEVDLESALTELLAMTSVTAPKYLRLYVTDLKVKALNSSDAFSSSAVTYQNVGKAGAVWTADTWNADALNAVFSKLNLSSTDWSELQVVCDLTDDLTGSYNVGNVIMEQPSTMKARMIVTFKKSKDHYSSTEPIDYTSGQTIQHENYATGTVELDLSTATDFSTINGKFDNKLAADTEVNKFYIRWYVADEDGDRVIPVPAGLTLTPKAGSGLAPFVYTNGDGTTDEVGQMWYSGDAATFNMDLLKMDVVTSADVNLNDYKIVCVMTTFDGSAGVTYDAATGFSREPKLNVMFTYDFKSDWAGSLISNPYHHSKEVLIENSTVTDVVIPLNESYNKILSEYGSAGGDLSTHFHIRWYVEKKNGTEWEKVTNPEEYLMPIYTARDEKKLDPVINDKYHYKEEGYGIFWNTEMNMDATQATHPKNGAPVTNTDGYDSDNVKNWLNVTFTKPDASVDWHDYRVVVLMSDEVSDAGVREEVVSEETTTYFPGESYEITLVSKRVTRFTFTNGQVWELTENFNENGNRTSYLVDVIHEPTKLNMVYYYNFFVKEDFKFVHYNGASERDLMKKNDKNMKGTKYYAGSTTMNATVTQYYWDNGNSAYVVSSEDIRQAVHTVEYDIYVDTRTGAASVPLKLGLEQYFETNGGNVEPSAYFRWYDWKTDLGADRLSIVGTDLTEFLDYDTHNCRGFFKLNNTDNAYFPNHEKIGVTFNPVGLDGEAIIACDVSKYYDGIYPGPTMIHEPTLSIRYLFHIHPASECVTAVNTGAAAFNQAIADLKAGTKTFYDTTSGGVVTAGTRSTMFNNLFENNGRVVVSVKDDNSQFVTRANLPELTDYYLPTAIGGDQTPVQANTIKWYAYYEDEEGLWYNSTPLTVSAWESIQNARINAYTLSRLTGTYQLLAPAATSKTITAQPGQRYHLVGYLSNSSNASNEVPVCYYDLRFVNAPAYQLQYLYTQTELVNRRDEYLEAHLKKAGKTLNFDDIENGTVATLTTQNDNHSEMPLDWTEAHYGFCYPSIDSYRIRQGLNTYDGISPLHGDYQLLKSMNDPNVSATSPYTYHWWDGVKLHDYTYRKAEYIGASEREYGTFLYVDASDESRTISTLDFDASLCAGSEIHFTMYIADMTEGTKLSPQVMAHVYGLNSDGTRTQVISFLSCELKTVTEHAYEHGKWYQIYGHGTIPDNIDVSQFSTYEVDIDNYSRHTNGADYCVDQITFYTNTAQVKVKMEDASCTDDKVKMSIYMDAENLKETALGVSDTQQKLYWRICDEDGNVVKGAGLYADTDDGSMTFGTSLITTNYKVDASGNPTTAFANEGFFKGDDSNIYFYLVKDKYIPLAEDKQYYVSIYNIPAGIEGAGPTNAALWGAPNQSCTVCSDMFAAQKMNLSFLDGDLATTGTVEGGCGSSGDPSVSFDIVLRMPDSTEPTGFKTYNTVHFDFFRGSKDEYNAITNLKEALDDYRAKYPTYNGLNPDYESDNSTYYNVISANLSKLMLVASTSFDYTFSTPGLNEFVAEAVEVKKDGKVVCSPISFSFKYNTSGGTPELVIGFDDVDYSTAGAKRVIRVGLEQLNKMRTQNYMLHIPVNMYKDKNGETAKKVYFSADSYLVLSETNDPTQTSAKGTAKFAHIVPINSGETRPYVDKTHMYLSLDLSSTNCGIDFHEGYEYEVATTFHDEDDESDLENACLGDLFLVIKVVPEFVTWEAQHVDNNGNPTTAATAFWSANWYNDGNWQRSTRDVLYKDQNVTGKVQNTATAGHPAGYDNNGEGTLSSLTTGSNPGFVPMKFTYVTLPTGNHAPSLINEPRVTGVGVGSRRQGGGFLDLTQTTLLTDRSPRDPDGTPNSERTNSKPTENIYYDMLVRYSYSSTDPYGEGCFGHRYMKDDGTWADQGEENMTAKVFDVEKFQGNVCREIYFKPGAELLRQQRLTYEKAWVETELEPNKWYLLTSPLLNTYAGDMYVPASMTNVADGNTVVGRQVTEAFQPITFDKTKGYSRTNYPIYQHSWGLNNGTVYVKENDLRANSYSANLNFGSVTTSLVEWGHTFNDVQVPYSTMRGFSIRAHKKLKHTDGTTLPNTLIRLPKADTNYDYYEWNDNSADPAAGNGIKAVSKPDFEFKLEGVTLFTVPKSYRLVTDEDANDGDLQYSISAMQQNGDYVLVGNPYMVSIDMKKFFADNSNLDQTGYWTYEASAAVAHAKPTLANTAFIKPMQGFFVKKGTATDIVFNRQMQVDGNFPPQAEGGNAPAPLMAITLSAQNNNGSSSATVAIDESSSAGYAANEDVETLFDSNLSDVPMVYTVADGMAVSINQMPQIGMVPFGVVCNDNVNVNVNVNLNDNDNVNDNDNALRSTLHAQPSTLHSPLSTLYVYDALTGESTEVGEDGTVTIQANDYGRYYLTSSIAPSPWERAGGEALISVRGGQVTVTATDNLQQVRAVSISGATMYQAADCGTNCQFQLQPGTYVIEADSAAGRKTVKVFVR